MVRFSKIESACSSHIHVRIRTYGNTPYILSHRDSCRTRIRVRVRVRVRVRAHGNVASV